MIRRGPKPVLDIYGQQNLFTGQNTVNRADHIFKTMRLWKMDPIGVIRRAAELAYDHRWRQRDFQPAEVDLHRMWLSRQNSIYLGVLVSHPLEQTYESFQKHWGEIRTERDLSREVMDAAALVRHIYSSGSCSSAIHTHRLWFLAVPMNDTFIIQKVFSSRWVDFTKNYAAYVYAAGLRSMPPQMLAEGLEFFTNPQNFAAQDADFGRAVLFMLVKEARTRINQWHGQDVIGRKPRENTKVESACPYAAESELEYARNIAKELREIKVTGEWTIGNEAYRRMSPPPAALESARQVMQTKDGQTLLGYATRVADPKTGARVAVAIPQPRVAKGRFGRISPSSRGPVTKATVTRVAKSDARERQ